MNDPAQMMLARTGNPPFSKQEMPDKEPLSPRRQSNLVMAGFAPSTVHPRQRVQARRQGRRRNNKKRGTRRYHPAQQPPTQDLSTALRQLEGHVPATSAAQDALDRVLVALDGLEKQLQPPETLMARHKLLVHQPTPAEWVDPFPDHHLRLYRATYEANDPSEDRSTVVIGEDFVFAGVWDGHGGYQCAEYTQNTIFETFADLFEETKGDIPMALQQAFGKTNRDYYHHARGLNQHAAYFAGTCAIACFVDLTRQKFWCANLGDSRAVMGIFRDNDGQVRTLPLSVDHTAANLMERQRLQSAHPHDPDVVVDMTEYESSDSDSDDSYQEPPDWRVKQLAAFTRSIGDLQLKEKNTSALFNSYMPESSRILPRPGTVAMDSNKKVPPYISTEAEVKEFAIKDSGFLIIACDGVWDEMDNEEAVECVAELLCKYDRKPEVNIAELFIEEVLQKAVERLRETDDYEANLTLEEMKQRPKGKATDGARSLLHDDITVVIVQLGTLDAYHKAQFTRSNHSRVSRRMTRSNSRSGDALWSSVEDLMKITADNPNRGVMDKQIVEMMESFEGMNKRHLRILFNALDMDGNGSLDREEVGRLIAQIMLTQVSPTVVDLAFGEMDMDNDGTVDFGEFAAFFGHSRDD